jgi:hypothetical protein
MVVERFPTVAPAYMSLQELSHRTRYDVLKLGPMTIPGARMHWTSIKNFCEGLNGTREKSRHKRPGRAGSSKPQAISHIRPRRNH